MSEKAIIPLDAVRRRLLLRGIRITQAYFDDKRTPPKSIKRRQNTSLRHRRKRRIELVLEEGLPDVPDEPFTLSGER